MNPEETTRLKARLIECQSLLGRHRAGRELTPEEARRLSSLISTLDAMSLGELLLRVPRIRVSVFC